MKSLQNFALWKSIAEKLNWVEKFKIQNEKPCNRLKKLTPNYKAISGKSKVNVKTWTSECRFDVSFLKLKFSNFDFRLSKFNFLFLQLILGFTGIPESLNYEILTLGSGRWTLDPRRWALLSGCCTLDSKLRPINVRLWTCSLLTAKSWSTRGASHQPAFMGNCLTISHMCLPVHLVDELVLVFCVSWWLG